MRGSPIHGTAMHASIKPSQYHELRMIRLLSQLTGTAQACPVAAGGAAQTSSHTVAAPANTGLQCASNAFAVKSTSSRYAHRIMGSGAGDEGNKLAGWIIANALMAL